MPSGELARRILVAAVGIPLAVAVIYAGEWVFGAVLALLALMGTLEYYRLLARTGVRPFVVIGGVAAPLMLLAVAARPSLDEAALTLWILALACVLGAAAMAVWSRPVGSYPIAAVAGTAFGPLYVAGTLTFAVLLRAAGGRVAEVSHHVVPGALVGTALVAFPITVTWIGDTFAYFIGRRWGRRKLIPAVSPGKTVEGAIAGFIASTLCGALYAMLVMDLWLGFAIPVAAGALAGAVIAVAAQVGDLAESLLKREAGVKDSGALLPGHGGVLDRFDALFFAIPVGYWLVWLALPVLHGGP